MMLITLHDQLLQNGTPSRSSDETKANQENRIMANFQPTGPICQGGFP